MPRREIPAKTGALVSLATVAVLTGLVAAPAHADAAAARTMVVDAKLAEDGVLHVTETLTFAGTGPSSLQQRLATSRDTGDQSRYVYQVGDVTAKAGGNDLQPSTSSQDGNQVISLDASRAAGKPVVISYTVRGTTRAVAASSGQPARTEFSWPLLQGLSVPVTQVSGTVTAPGTVTFVDCESGAPASLSPCSTFGAGTHQAPQPTFTDGPRAAGDEVRLDFGLRQGLVAPTAVVKEKWSVAHAFRVSPATLAASLLPLLLGGAALYLVHRRRGRDQAAGRPTPVAEFAPVGPGQSRFTVLSQVRPGHVGTVADERVDPIDVTATLLDLAVRGWLRIVELPRDRARQSLDWRFERREPGDGELRPFEARLRDAVAPANGPGALVSEVNHRVMPVISQVQDDLYQDVTERGWFARRPDAIRSRWGVAGWALLALAVVATGLLVAFTHFGLLGLALVILALGALLVGQEMPARTASGTALLGGLSSLASQLQTQPTNQVPADAEYAELSRILPYAVVLGGRERWVEALVAADKDAEPDGTDLDWYHAPDDWHLADLPDSLTALIITLQGQLYAR